MPKIKIIVECANYWHGDEHVLEDTVEAAASCQADFFKLQLSDAERMGNPWKHKREAVRACHIRVNKLNEIKKMCDTYGMGLLATVNHAHLVELLPQANVSNVKIASGQIHPQLIDAIKQHKWERIFVSTGMLESYAQLDLLQQELYGCADELVIMHCVSLYPTNDAELNLTRITALRDAFSGATCNVTFGYSDHHMDDLPCFLAVGLGATYIEKHFRIPESFGPTSEIASLPAEMGNLVGLCKRMGNMLGDGKLTMQAREQESFEHYKTRFVI